MANVKVWYDAVATGLYQPIDALLTSLSGLTTSANKGVYFTGTDTAATYDLTAFGRSLGGAADAAAAIALLDGLAIDAESAANPGYLKLSNGMQVMWGSFAHGGGQGNGFTVTYPVPCAAGSIAVITGASASNATGNPCYTTACSSTGFTYSNWSANCTAFWLAVGY